MLTVESPDLLCSRANSCFVIQYKDTQVNWNCNVSLELNMLCYLYYKSQINPCQITIIIVIKTPITNAKYIKCNILSPWKYYFQYFLLLYNPLYVCQVRNLMKSWYFGQNQWWKKLYHILATSVSGSWFVYSKEK
jgi:hypothetical protein